jgi:hypothetical protein
MSGAIPLLPPTCLHGMDWGNFTFTLTFKVDKRMCGFFCVPVTTTLKYDRQCTYNITLMQVQATIVAVEN